MLSALTCPSRPESGTGPRPSPKYTEKLQQGTLLFRYFELEKESGKTGQLQQGVTLYSNLTIYLFIDVCIRGFVDPLSLFISLLGAVPQRFIIPDAS